jgi:hypothetical protein
VLATFREKPTGDVGLRIWLKPDNTIVDLDIVHMLENKAYLVDIMERTADPKAPSGS